MKTALFFTSLLASTAALAQSGPAAAPSVPAADTYFGVKVDDPYRNLENLQDPAVAAWMKAQSEYTRQTLDAIPGRKGLLDKMVEMDKRKAARVTDLRVADNDRYFYYKSRPQDQQPKLYCRDGYKGQEVLLFDPEGYEAGKVYNINGFSPSPDGSKVSFGISEKGTELGRTLIMDVKTRKLYPEQIPLNRGGGEWLPDNQTLAYLPYNNDDLKDMAARQNTQCRLHRVGTLVAQDQIVFSSQLYPKLGIKPSDYPYAGIDRDTKLAYGFLYSVDRYMNVFYAPSAALTKPNIPWKPLFRPSDEVTNFVTDEQNIYFVTSRNTPRQKLMRMPAARPDVATAEVLVPEAADESINDEQLKTTKDGVYFVRTKNGVGAKLYFVARGSKTVQELKLPRPAGRLELTGKNAQSPDLWVTMGGWTSDRQRYRYTAASRQFTPEPLSSEAQYPEFADLVVEEVMVPSHDGVQVPLSLVYKKGLKRDKAAPTLMIGYGAYSRVMEPTFMPPFLLWAQQGGVLAVPHVRGGGELGEAWHKAGQKTTKPNTWKDLIACAEYLTKNNYTAPGKIAINGGSAGGILIGRAMTERPDLFAVAIPEVGCMNAVRMENSPNGPVNVPEFGTMAKEDEAKALLEMDAYHHLKPGTSYPATLVTAGFNDPRVIAWQPAKFAARLQASNASGKPVLFFTDYEAGHGMGDSRLKQFESIADLMAFGLWQTNADGFQPNKVAAK
ncbi:prolyl oligopeptidase family serine peptidase [Hymenobacter psychrotolerans]|uniref:prolyl oligopeptidase n=1 Tax=Hymenobacter psychrotolerans DSM 18569 TaxID=1121959 RepID=A0A1M7DPL3_9BACT|nr:prolyl oligopeptidase family serine peptidase [Hymenobacter psychrotolerans]SHL81405.1 oligopeptidase B Serine peptidase. MEROPS family S09A [Hymenobacter psychrotolerans DSM 18569]